MKFTENDVKRFSTFFRTSDEGCWEWEGSLNTKGYGVFQQGGQSRAAHRVAYRVAYHLAYPNTDPLLHICHTCDNPKCVRLSHLWPGTPKENQEDKAKKGRAASGERNGNAKLKDAQRDVILKSSESSRELAVLLGVSQRHVNRIRAEALA